MSVRTTISIDGSLLSEAKREAATAGVSLSRLIETALRSELQRRRDRKHFVMPTYAGRGPHPGVDLDGSASLLDLVEPT